MRRIEALLIWICSCALSFGEESDPKEVRLLISETSEVKMDYPLTETSLTKNSSHEKYFGEAKFTVPELIKKAKEHIHKAQLPKIAPFFSSKLQSNDFTSEERDGPKGSFPGLKGCSKFWRMELCRYDEFLYWRLDFTIDDFIGSSPHVTSVVFYLNGEVAEIVDHKKEE